MPGPDGRLVKHQAELATFSEDLLALRDWLVALGVTRVGMEATGVYLETRHEPGIRTQVSRADASARCSPA